MPDRVPIRAPAPESRRLAEPGWTTTGRVVHEYMREGNGCEFLFFPASSSSTLSSSCTYRILNLSGIFTHVELGIQPHCKP